MNQDQLLSSEVARSICTGSEVALLTHPLRTDAANTLTLQRSQRELADGLCVYLGIGQVQVSQILIKNVLPDICPH